MHVDSTQYLLYFCLPDKGPLDTVTHSSMGTATPKRVVLPFKRSFVKGKVNIIQVNGIMMFSYFELNFAGPIE